MKIKILILMICLFPLMLLSSPKNITIVTINWPPYVIHPSTSLKGYNYDIVNEAFKRSNYTVKFEFFPWSRGMKMVKEGERDAIFPTYYSKDRAQFLAFSNPFSQSQLGLFKRKEMKEKWSPDAIDKPTFALRELSKYRFGVTRGFVNTKEFDSADFLIKEPANTDELNLKKLNAKRVDFIVIDKLVALDIIQNKFPHFKKTLEFMEPPMQTKNLYLTFSKKIPNHKEQLKAFNAGLKEIQEDGTIDSIMEKYFKNN